MGKIAQYPAKAHLARVAAQLPRPLTSNFILLRAPQLIARGFSDQSLPFSQESNFYYASGSTYPGWVLLYDIEAQLLTFFIPPLRTGRDVVYLGQLPSVEAVKQTYEVDSVKYLADSLGKTLMSVGGLFYDFSNADLLLAFARARVTKDEYEIELVRIANSISCTAHEETARRLLSMNNEREIEAIFLLHCSIRGGKEQAYAPIVASGRRASVLHYGANNEALSGRELVLIDAACEYKRFSARARRIYSLVLETQKACIAMIGPDVLLNTVQEFALKSVLLGAIDLDLIRGVAKDNCPRQGQISLQEALDKGLARAFLPHGLSHSIGLDVHDVMPNSLREDMLTLQPHSSDYYCNVAQVMPLLPGTIVTVEPGFYFNVEWLEMCFAELDQSGKYYNKSEIEKYLDVGGVRIEDCILVTKTGNINLTAMPKEIHEIEDLVTGTLKK